MSFLKWALALVCVAAGAWLTPGAVFAQAQTSTHEVQPGESVAQIAQANGLSSATLMAVNSLADPDLLKVGQQLVVPPADGVLHTVQPGETLVGIADSYGVGAADLVAANHLQGSADNLAIGAQLLVPGLDLAVHAARAAAPTQDAATISVHPRAQETYTVQPGDTLGDIAWKYSVSSDALLATNGIADPDHLTTGVTLVIPTTQSTIATAPPPVAAAPPPVAAALAPVAAAPAPVAAAPAPIAAAPAAAGPAATAPAVASAPAAVRAPAPVPAAPAPASAPAPAPTDRPATALVSGYALGAGAVSSHTSSGTVAHWGTVAADPRVYPMGTRLRIDGLGDTVFVVEDTGSAVRGNVLDVWFPDAASARQLGATVRQVTVVTD